MRSHLKRLGGVFDQLAGFFYDLAGGRVAVGPVVIVSSKRESQAQISAFELGRDHFFGSRRPEPVKRPERRLKLV